MKRELIDRAAALAGVAAWDWQELYLPAHFKQVIEDCPTVEERRRGRWVDGIYIQNKRTKDVKEARECSECGARYLRFYDVGDGFDCVPPNYCPNCGAKMDAGEEE